MLTADVQQNHPEEWGSEEQRVADAVAKLRELAGLGVRTIVDPTVVGLGRYIPRIQRIAEQVELNIIVATGCYTYEDVPFFFHHRGPGLDAAFGAEVPDPMVDMFVRDVTEGIAGTGVCAAFLECAIDAPGLTSGVQRVMRAVAAAHGHTGSPARCTPTPGEQTGLVVKKVLAEEGVDPRRVVLGHSGDTTDADHLCELADAGFLLGMDRFGIDLATTCVARADTVVETCHRGYAESRVLSQDASCYIDWVDPAVMATLPRWRYTHIHQDVLPHLREHGATDAQTETMLGANPRRYFENVGTY